MNRCGILPVRWVIKNSRFDVWREFCAVVFIKTPAGGLSVAGVISTGVRLIGELHHRFKCIYHLHDFIKRNLRMVHVNVKLSQN
jgi:hypothetical protein